MSTPHRARCRCTMGVYTPCGVAEIDQLGDQRHRGRPDRRSGVLVPSAPSRQNAAMHRSPLRSLLFPAVAAANLLPKLPRRVQGSVDPRATSLAAVDPLPKRYLHLDVATDRARLPRSIKVGAITNFAPYHCVLYANIHRNSDPAASHEGHRKVVVLDHAANGGSSTTITDFVSPILRSPSAESPRVGSGCGDTLEPAQPTYADCGSRVPRCLRLSTRCR